MTVFQKFMLVLLGMVCAVAIFCITVGIGCAINGVTFGQQIVDWFGTAKPAVDSGAEALAMIKPII